MANVVPVESGDVRFYVTVSDGGGPASVAADGIHSFEGVRNTIQAIASEINEVWEKVKPSEASVEFGLNLTAKTGKLTGLLVEGGAAASIKVTLSWTASEASE